LGGHKIVERRSPPLTATRRVSLYRHGNSRVIELD
jgi:hypothetical protein